MVKLYLADIDYNIILPLNLSNGSVYDVELTTAISTAYKLKFKVNTLLDGLYDFIVNDREYKLILEIDDGVEITKLGFSQSSDLTTHIASIGTLTQGSQSNTAFSVDNTINIKSELTIDKNREIALGDRKYNYLKNKKLYKKDYFEIVTFDYNNDDSVSNDDDKLRKAKQTIYDQAIDYNNAIKEGEFTRFQNGVIELEFSSSLLDISKELRTLALNLQADSRLVDFVNQISANIYVEVLNNNNEIINFSTGILDNYKILCKLVEVNKKLSFIEKGLIKKDGKNLTWVQIGNFDDVGIKFLANNMLFDDIFDNKSIRIAEINQTANNLDISFNSSRFITAGSKIKVEYKEFVQNLEGKKIKTMDINKTQIYSGYNNININQFY